MRGQSVLRGVQRIKNKLFGSAVSPEEFETQLEKRAEELEKKASHLETEAQLRKRAAAAKLRVREAEKEMGRSWIRALKLVAVLVVILLIVFAVLKSCEEIQGVGEVEQGVEGEVND